jgi:hypothetical protein
VTDFRNPSFQRKLESMSEGGKRIADGPAAWPACIDKRLRLSFEPAQYPENGAPD